MSYSHTWLKRLWAATGTPRRFGEIRASRLRAEARRKAQAVRHIPDSYFKGYRRAARTRAELTKHPRGVCWTCRHQVGYVTLHCGKGGACEWKECYVLEELTQADREAGQKAGVIGRWLDLPPPIEEPV